MHYCTCNSFANRIRESIQSGSAAVARSVSGRVGAHADRGAFPGAPHTDWNSAGMQLTKFGPVFDQHGKVVCGAVENTMRKRWH